MLQLRDIWKAWSLEWNDCMVDSRHKPIHTKPHSSWKRWKFRWEGIYKEWFNLCLDKITLENTQSKVLESSSIPPVHHQGDLGVATCYLRSLIKSSEVIAFVFGFASHVSYDGTVHDDSACPERDNTEKGDYYSCDWHQAFQPDSYLSQISLWTRAD